MLGMKDFFSANVRGRNVLLLFIAATTVYLVMLLVTIPKLLVFSNGKKILDMMPGGYNTAYVVDLLKSLGEEGRLYYLTTQLPLDFLYPGLFAVAYALIFIFFLRRINKHETAWRLIAFLPVVAGIADYIENFGIISMIRTFPNVSAGLVGFSSAMSVAKASATTVYFISLLFLFVVVIASRLRQRPGATG